MREHPLKWLFVLLLCAAGIWFLLNENHVLKTKTTSVATNISAASQSSANHVATTNSVKTAATLAVTNKFPWRLSNTSKTIGQLAHDPQAILLENAFIETGSKINLSIPKNLQSQGDPGAYIVQAHGPIGLAFRYLLANAGATIVSYIPNDSYLVRASQSVADGLATSPLVQAVIPYEPYYKVQAPLLAMAQQPLPPQVQLNLALFPDQEATTLQQIKNLGGHVLASADSLAGYPVVKVEPPLDWTSIAQLPGVHIVEPTYRRTTANDLARPALQVAADSITTSNYMNLYGSNVIVEVNDTGIDTNHPDLNNSQPLTWAPYHVLYNDPAEGVDTDGHGTHVAGIIAGDGDKSETVTNASGSILPVLGTPNTATNFQFRGKAPFAQMFAMNYLDDDQTLQQTAATNGALISNNSWTYGDFDYDLAAASYDAATRDALPFTTGSQPVLFVFAAGNDGNTAGTVDSPGTAKDLITVGALEELRFITNQVTNADGTISQPWLGETDNTNTVPDFSSCGNVGIGTEGTFGRFKPDVVAPGTFVVSCRSTEWNTNAYYNPTNNTYYDFPDFIPTNSVSVSSFQFFVPSNTVEVIFYAVTNVESTSPTLPPIPLYLSTNNSAFGYIGSNDIGGNSIEISPDPSTLDENWSVEASNVTAAPLPYDLIVDVQTTNNVGNYFQVLESLNDQLGTQPEYYRYESGTSMSAAAISGFLALIQDYFTNQFYQPFTPSPALLKAMTINGARTTVGYDLEVDNNINYEGWGQPGLSNSIPMTITNVPLPGNNNVPGPFCASYFREQGPTNALATGDQQTFIVNLNTNDFGNYLPLRVTVAWTDPPGDPAAAIKLVNSLELVVTDLDEPSIVYYGNDISSGQIFNNVENATNPPIVDTINNVQNIYIQPFTLTNTIPDADYSVTVIGNRVNVNAVSAHTNNDVQDFAMVISAGDMGEITDALQVTDDGVVSIPYDQNITIGNTNTILLNQIAGANTPLLGSNTVPFTANTVGYGTNGEFTIGMSNQWHFYIVTNTTTFTNAAFITFGAVTLSIPRMGVFANSDENSTTPGADLDLLVTRTFTDPNAAALTNLDPIEVSNCVNNASGDGSSLVSGGTDFVAYTNAQPQEVFYIGVKSESHMGATYGFIPIFTDIPFSSQDQNGNEYLTGLNVPSPIPDGTPSHPGVSYVFSLALFPIVIQDVIVTNSILHQNFGDLVGSLTHNSTSVVLNNHDSLANPPGPYTLIYDDSLQNDVVGSIPSDGPGSLRDYQGATGEGVWQLTEEGTALGQTGMVLSTSTFLQKYQNPQHGVTVTIQPGQWFYTFIDVPSGYTNMELYGSVTNVFPTGQAPIQMYLNTGGDPSQTTYLFEADLTNPPPAPNPFPTFSGPWNIISDGPPLQSGLYYIGLFNPGTVAETVYLEVLLNGVQAVPQPTLFSSTNVSPISVDAVTNTSIFINNSNNIETVNVGMVVQYPRISDLAFTLVSPTGQRILLMENRGGPTSTNAGGVFYITNSIGTTTANGSSLPTTNTYNLNSASGTISVSYNMYTIPDEMTIYYGNNPANFNTNAGNTYFLFDSGMVSGTSNFVVNFGPGAYTSITVIMNQFGNTNGAPGQDAWTYTLGGSFPSFNYLTFTDDTNLTTTPIKFAIPPFDLRDEGTNYTFCDFDLATNGDYFAQTNIYDAFGGWTVPTNLVTQVTNNVIYTNNYNEVSIVSNTAIAFQASTNLSTNFLALGYGIIQRTNLVTPFRMTTVSYEYRGPGIAGWWRGEGDARDSSDAEQHGQNGALIGRFDFPMGEVSQSFAMENNGQEYDFAGTNGYVQIRQQPFLTTVAVVNGTNGDGGGVTNFTTVQSSYLDVGTGPGFTVEGWINPTNVSFQQPLVEWLARVPTNGSDTNLNILAGPFLDRGTDHYYYLLAATNWPTSETWAEEIGGHLATVDTADEQNWIYDTFAAWNGRNRNLWIGLTNFQQGSFGYTDGTTNISYANWMDFQPTNCDGARNYTFMWGSTNQYPGLWVLSNSNGFVCNSTATNLIYGVVEVTNLQTNGVQFWISITNVPGTTNIVSAATNGCLFANLLDITNGSHWIYSAPNLIQSNVFQHVALTYDTNSGIANLFYDGTNVASTNLGVFIPNTTGDVLLGKDMNLETNNYYGGQMDEMSIYGRALSDAEIMAIYSASAYTTNRLIGKFDPAITPPLSLAEAQVVLGTMTNTILGDNTTWQEGSFSFISQTNSLPMQISGITPGMLLDDFTLYQAPLGNMYYQPEQALSELKGENAYGNWTLEIWNTRNNTLATNAEILSWQLQVLLQTNSPEPVPVGPQQPTTVTVLPGQTVNLQVSVPTWAISASNVLDSSTLPLNVFFNPSTPTVGSQPPDTFMFSGTSGSELLLTNLINAPTNIVPGGTYYIGLQNNGTHAATATFEVDFNVTALTNDVPFNDTLVTNTSIRYFSFTVSTNNPYEATFQLLKMTGNADLVVSKGFPLPTLTSSDYGSFDSGVANENIYVLTNSTPVPLTPGTWYLGVFNRDTHAVNYTVLAQELDLPIGLPPGTNLTIIPLTNGVPFNYTQGPGAALTNFFSFLVTNTWTITNGGATTITNYVPSIHFELYNLTGNGDLTVQSNAPPFAPPFFQSSQQPRTVPEFIQIVTNSALTNLAATWYLGVPNETTNLIHFTIIAVIDTNNYFPAFPGAEGAGASALGGSIRNGSTNNTVYHVVNLDDSGPGSLRDAVSSTNRTVIFDISGPILLQSPLIITNSDLTIVGQTSPTGGVTVAGAPAILSTNVHDVVIRYLRFRPNYLDQTATEVGLGGDALQFNTVSNVIADHVSTLWSSNNDLSVLNSSNVTVQWSILSDTLTNGTQSPPFGALVRYGSGAVSLHHNLFADNYTGSPRLGDNISLDFVNNVIFNWVTNAGFSSCNDIIDDPVGFTNYLNYRCNYLIAGPQTITTNIAFWGGTNTTWIFQTNNFIDSDTNGILNGADTAWDMFTNWDGFTNLYTETNEFRLPPVSVDEAYLAYEKVLDFAGDSMFRREPAETNIVENVRRQTGAIISSPGILPTDSSTLIYLNSSGDGIPDFWKITYGQAVTNTYNNFALDSSGYSELEEFDNWLAGPHAVTATNTPVGVNLEKLFGKTGNLSFYLTNAIHGTVYLTNVLGAYTNTGTYSNTIAIYTPTNATGSLTNYSGFGSFDVYVTNNDTVAYYGPVTVNVFIGSSQPTYSQFVGILLPDPTNSIGGNTIQWYQVNVPTNAVAATNTLVFANEPLNVWYSTNETTVFPYDVEMLTDVTNGVAVIATNGVPPPTLVPGTTYYLGIQNTNNTATTYSVSLGFDTTGGTPLHGGSPQTNTIPAGGVQYYTVTVPANAIAATNIIDFDTGPLNLWVNTNTLPVLTTPPDTELLTGYNNPTTPGIGSPIMTLSSNPGLVPGSTYYLAVDNTAGASPVTYAIEVDFELFYTPPVLPVIPTNLTAIAGTTFTVTNTATDTNSGTLYYYLTTAPPVGATVSSNGIITWAVPPSTPAENVLFTEIASNSFTMQTATNSFTVTVIPELSSTTGPLTNTVPGGGINWLAVNVPTNAIWATNILLFATNFPVNVLFTTNFPPTTNGAYTLMSNETNGTSILGLNTVPTNIVPGSFYYLGVQNTNSAAVTYALEVNFDLVTLPAAPFSETLPATLVTTTSAQLNGFATPNTVVGTAWFEWGVNTNYGFGTTPQVLGSGNSVQYVTNVIGLPIPGQVYHYRLDVSNALGVAYGEDQLFAISGVAVWGENIAGVTNVPLGLSDEVAIAAEMEDGVALNSHGHVTVWGDNTFSQTQVPSGLNNVANIAAGNGFFALALQNGTVTGWGDNSSGQTSVPTNLNNVVAIAAGESHGLALQNNGTVVAWGANGYGQTSVPANLNNVVAIAAGSVNSLALLNNGTVVAWGGGETNSGIYPDYGQSMVPAGLTNVVAIASYGYASTALKSDGTVVSWGENNFGQDTVPGGLANVASIANGLYHSLAAQETGRAIGWGDNSYGESTIPAGLTNIYAIAAGNYFSMALESPLSINLSVTPLTGGSPVTNTIAADSVVYYTVSVPANAVAATNLFSFATPPLNLWFNQMTLPQPANPPDTLLLSNSVSGTSNVLTTNGLPPLVPGQTYYLAIQNTNNISGSYVFGVYFNLSGVVVGGPTNPVPISGIIYTNIGGINGYLLTWYAPTNDIFKVQQTPSINPPVTWNSFSNIITYTGPSTTTNGRFTFFDNGSQYPFGPTRFYRLLLLTSSTGGPPVLPAISNQVAVTGTTFSITNTATDSNPGTLAYTLATSPSVSTTISSSGVITWVVPTNQALGNILFTTIVTNSSTTLSATNSFTVSVVSAPVLTISGIVYTNISGKNGYLLTWYAPTNDTFNVQMTPSINPPVVWSTFSNLVTYTGPPTNANGRFTFFDNGSQYPLGSTRFYRLLLLLQAPGALSLPAQSNYVLSVSQPLAVTNTATDSNPSAILNYAILGSPTPATNGMISAGGIINWTPGPADAGGAFTFTTVVTDNGVPPASATNSFTVLVLPAPTIHQVIVTSTNLTLQWSAPSNDLFQVQWTTNLDPNVVWATFPQTISSSTNSFKFTDTNAPTTAKFYRLLWTP